jgi:deoxyribodipyrimidine photo-lyase
MSMIPFSFEPTRAAGLARLAAFAPSSGKHYAAFRNTDEGAGERRNVSMLSPYLRFRMISEVEVLQAVLDRFSFAAAEKFIQEVFWRGYFKGHLETRPWIWADTVAALDRLDRGGADYLAATTGETGIDCFDHWVQELKATGYLHNHARMWFASIWIFTLRLPWQLGADFMYRHLIDGDPASNTLSWRWVGGLHTRGKTYLARPDNIATYTNGRFNPKGLATFAVALEEPLMASARAVPPAATQWPGGRFGLLVTSEDLGVSIAVKPVSVAVVTAPIAKPGGLESNLALQFRAAALDDAAERVDGAVTRITALDVEHVLAWCKAEKLETVAVAYAPVGPEADALLAIEVALAEHGIKFIRVRRSYDTLVWPHATKGFFGLKEKLPLVLEKLNVRGAQGVLI